MKYKEHLTIFIRGLKQYHAYAPKYFVSHSLGDIIRAVTPYVPVYFSARLIDALAQISLCRIHDNSVMKLFQGVKCGTLCDEVTDQKAVSQKASL